MRALIGFSLILIVGCSQLPPITKPRMELSSLVGTWCTLSPDGRSCVDHLEYFQDMTVRSCAIDSLNNKPVHSVAALKWQGQNICLKVTESDEITVTPIGYEFCFEVVESAPSLVKYRAIPNGEIFLNKRLPQGSSQCPLPAN
jgi:hypothetical protein